MNWIIAAAENYRRKAQLLLSGMLSLLIFIRTTGHPRRGIDFYNKRIWQPQSKKCEPENVTAFAFCMGELSDN
jgi:hypothetical protein